MRDNSLVQEDGIKKKASNWFTTRGLQLPKVVQTILAAYAKSIPQPSKMSSPSEENDRNSLPDADYMALAQKTIAPKQKISNLSRW